MGNERIIRVHKHLEWNQIIISFPFTAKIVTAIKTIPGRRYDIKTRGWRISFHDWDKRGEHR